jgi:hypothetical protein
MKKTILGCLAMLCSSWTWADNAFSIDDFTIAAGEEKEIEVNMFSDVQMSAFQFNIMLPEGVSIKNEDGYWVDPTDRLKNGRKFHNVEVALQSSGAYKIMVYSSTSLNIQGDSGDPVVIITLVASDQISTGSFTPAITNQEMTATDGTNENTTKYKIDDTTYNCSVTLSTTVTTLGYASFSWPKALDFTNSGLTAFIATTCNGSSLHLEPVTKVPANTGLILKGSAGSENTYSLKTTKEATDDVSSNLLSSNTAGEYTVESDDIYVLSNLDDGKPGFYLASQGIHVAKYKSYLQYPAGARRGLSFDEGTTTGIIDHSSATTADHNYYDLQGRRIDNPSSGIYVKAGKKLVIK